MSDSNSDLDYEKGRADDVELCHDTPAIHKLDVMTSGQFNWLLYINIGLTIYTFGHVLGLIVLCQTSWAGSKTEPNIDGTPFTYATCIPNRMYMIVLYMGDFLGRMLLIVLAILFVIRVARAFHKHRSQEQAWAVVMLFFTALSYTPALNIMYLHDNLFLSNQPEKWAWQYKWVQSAIINFRIANLFFASFGQFFYLWACAHSYSILEGVTERPSNLVFYGPKLFLLLFYGTFRLLLRKVWHLSPSKLPFVTTFSMLANFRIMNDWHTQSIIIISLYTAVEAVVVFCIFRCIVYTSRVLKEAPYLKYRAKQLGFRFFVMQNIIAFSLFIIADSSILLFVPRDYAIYFRLNPPHSRVFFNYRYGPIPRILNYVTCAITAYVNLPADSVGIMGWIRSSKEQADVDRTPITLKVREQLEEHKVRNPNTLVFELLIHLFNLSEASYNIQSPTERKREKCTQFIKDNEYDTVLQLVHEVTHTAVLILSRDDRIVVAFRGTTDMEQMKTDLKVNKKSISEVLPTSEIINIPDESHQVLDSIEWKNAKIHKGFAVAYKSVAKEVLQKVSELLNDSARPIYLTGHSLGGALATICSLDVLLSIGHKEIYVSTFGSPRCGDLFWRNIYNNLVEYHWRVAMRSDIVTTLPSVGYHHVGKRVALTITGEIFLDPNTIETLIWSSAGVGLSDHRTKAYKEALEKFCGKYLPLFDPVFLHDTHAECSEKLGPPSPRPEKLLPVIGTDFAFAEAKMADGKIAT